MRGILFVFALLALSVSVFALPDLIVKDIWWNVDSPLPGQVVMVTMQVQNIGGNYTGNSSYSYVGFYVDGQLKSAMGMGPLGPNQTTLINFTYTVTSTPNPHSITGAADYSNMVYESNENNNNRTEYMNVSSLLPDLVVNSTSWYPTNPYAGDTVTIYSNISNNGGASGLFVTRIWAGGSSPTLCQVYLDLPAWGSGAATCSHIAYANFTNSITTYADWYGNVTESNENNNQKNVYLPVRFCGDGTCDASRENCTTCPADCGACPPICGNGVCDPGENSTTCPADCPACTPRSYCSGKCRVVSVNPDCTTTTTSCGNYQSCSNGRCTKDLKSMCSPKPVAQVAGPDMTPWYIAGIGAVLLLGCVWYFFNKKKK